jgi:phage-related protein
MANFPSLSTPPNYPLREIIEDRAIKNKSEAGYVQTRLRATRQTKLFEVVYNVLSDSDKSSLKTFYDTVENVDSFNWTHPYTDVTYTVRFDTIPTFNLIDNDRWECSFTLREV